MPSDVDRIKSSLASFIQRTLGAKIINRIDYLAFYPCKVVVQNSDGTLDLIADDPRIGTPSGIPIRYGVPGISATVPAGSRCYLTFASGDPRKPIVVDWEKNTVLTINIDSSVALNINLGTGTIAISSGTISISCSGTVDISGGTVNINSGTVNVGSGADSPIARYTELKAAFDIHVHTTATTGNPTSIPTVLLPTNVGASKGNVK